MLFLGHNIQSRSGTKGLVARFRAAKSDAWLALDHEGGYVQRLDETLGYAAIPKAGDVAQIGLDEARSIYKKAADAFADAGFNFNLAPIADLHHDRNTIIGTYRRVYGSDSEIIAAYCTAFIDAYKRRGVACALKHFPGHGRSSKDSHHGLVDLTNSWPMEEAAPFGDLIRNGRAHAIMSGHLVNRHFDPTGTPATLSRPILQGLLRQKMQFEGVIMTDDLDMAGVRKQYSRRQAVIASIAAGNDLIVISNTMENDPSLPERIVEWVDEAITSGELDPETIGLANARLDKLARDPNSTQKTME
jgi:beta-N-acetylhexosaminidase